MKAKRMKQYTLQKVLRSRINNLPEDKLWELYAITNRYEAERREAEEKVLLKGA